MNVSLISPCRVTHTMASILAVLFMFIPVCVSETDTVAGGSDAGLRYELEIIKVDHRYFVKKITNDVESIREKLESEEVDVKYLQRHFELSNEFQSRIVERTRKLEVKLAVIEQQYDHFEKSLDNVRDSLASRCGGHEASKQQVKTSDVLMSKSDKESWKNKYETALEEIGRLNKIIGELGPRGSSNSAGDGKSQSQNLSTSNATLTADVTTETVNLTVSSFDMQATTEVPKTTLDGDNTSDGHGVVPEIDSLPSAASTDVQPDSINLHNELHTPSKPHSKLLPMSSTAKDISFSTSSTVDVAAQSKEATSDRVKVTSFITTKTSLDERTMTTAKVCHKKPRSCADYCKRGYCGGRGHTKKLMIDPLGTCNPWPVSCDFMKSETTKIPDFIRPDYSSVIHHDHEPKDGRCIDAHVYECSKQQCKSFDITYNTPMDQIRALVQSSDACIQYLSYRCKLSPLQFTDPTYPDSEHVPNAAWFAWDGTPRYYLGATPLKGMCPCGMSSQGCKEKSFNCNCDALSFEETEDGDFLIDKTSLPVTKLSFGGETGQSRGCFTLGPLICYDI